MFVAKIQSHQLLVQIAGIIYLNVLYLPIIHKDCLRGLFEADLSVSTRCFRPDVFLKRHNHHGRCTQACFEVLDRSRGGS